MKLTERKVQALKLLAGADKMQLTHYANMLVSRQAKELLEEDLIIHAPERWRAYRLTELGCRVLAAICRQPGCFLPRCSCVNHVGGN